MSDVTCSFCGLVNSEAYQGLFLSSEISEAFICETCIALAHDTCACHRRVRAAEASAKAIDARCGQTEGLDPKGESADPERVSP